MKKYEEPQLKCAMFSSESISAAADASGADTPVSEERINLNEWLTTKSVIGDVAVVHWVDMTN